jgi:riboflavin transporter FmnP
MNAANRNKLIRQVSLSLLLLVAVLQVITVIMMVFDFRPFDVGDVHSICGFILLGLVIVHILVFRKNLKHYLFPQK